MDPTLTRRAVLKVAASAALAASPLYSWAQSATRQGIGKGKRVLFFTKSQGFAHEAITPKPNLPLPFGERLIREWLAGAGYELTVSKEGSLFTPENIEKFDVFLFYTDGVLTQPPVSRDVDQTSAMTEEGKVALLKAIEAGKGFVGLHSASATFSNSYMKPLPVTLAPEDWKGAKIDPYSAMIGAEFTSHGSQQKATIRVGSKTFPGLEDLKDFEMTEEWYAFTNLATDMHVILVQDTSTMRVNARSGLRETQYQGESYPETWARTQGKGRVFYTSMGHREDVWTNPVYRKVVMAGLAWAAGVAGAGWEPKPNLGEACPKLKKAM